MSGAHATGRWPWRRSDGRDDTALRLRLWELAPARPQCGSLRRHGMLRREGRMVNRKRVHRIDREEGLTMRLTRHR